MVVDFAIIVLVNFLDHLPGEFNGRSPGHDPDQVLRTDEPIPVLIQLLKAFADLKSADHRSELSYMEYYLVDPITVKCIQFLQYANSHYNSSSMPLLPPLSSLRPGLNPAWQL